MNIGALGDIAAVERPERLPDIGVGQHQAADEHDLAERVEVIAR